ncbi:MAG: ABC transporter [Betaproteobacteria bacterium RIFCSPLOWO2_02_67_12]|nr:MAG: ABC transporter [Betaproteobacteria bacterium RIFCSPLOWO2_02_67_12]OGA30366.1 MAG: ABC transporter [Betaproteobacteria bacterium RIFCSPLOWO2_02_FULL_68_150]OGA56601.1 MAG: ABC transporter [Betaproteobacteria bacterium RIFCSPLOWO2_12_FULL_67_28]
MREAGKLDRSDALNEAQTKKQWEVPRPGVVADDPLLKCLVLLTRLFNHPFSAETLSAGLPLVDSRLTPALFERAAERAGLSAKVTARELGKVSPLVLPVVLLLRDQRACILKSIKPDGRYEIVDADTGGMSEKTADELQPEYSGHVILVRQQLKFDSRTEHSAVPRIDHWFWGVVRRAWPIYGEVLLASLLVNLFALVMPLFIMNVYDRVVPNDTTETLWALVFGVLIVLAFDFGMRMLRGYLIDIAGKRIDVILSSNIFERAMGLRMEVRPASVGSFASNMHEFESFREFITSATITALVDLPFVFLFIGVIFWIGGWVGVVPLTAVPLIILVGLVLQRSLGVVILQTFRLAAQKQGLLIESLSSIETVKALSAEGMLQRKWEQLVGTIARLGIKARTLSSAIVNISVSVQQLASVGVIVVGVYLISERELTVGALVACTILTGRALAPLGQVAGLMTRYHQSVSALRTLQNIMQLPVERPPNKSFVHRPGIRGEIEFRGVTFSYPGQQTPALQNVSFKLAAGERVGLIGRIGSGKSTIEKLVLGLYQPSSGSILVDGVDVNQIDPATLRKNIGYVPQDVTLFYGTVKENILFSAPYADDAAMLRAAEIAGVTEFVHPSAQGFDLRIGERGEGLSGGQRQTVAIARALLLDPPVLIMDEPTNALDNRSEEIFKRKLDQGLAGKTFMLVTHRASLLTLVPRLIVLDGGRVVADGPKDQVMQALSGGKINVAKRA